MSHVIAGMSPRIGAAFAAVSALVVAAIAQPLPALNVSNPTTGGISAGAFMAVQVHVAFSSVRCTAPNVPPEPDVRE